MKELFFRLMKVFGKFIFGAVLFFVTGALYYAAFKEGIDSFYYPMAGIFLIIFMTIICIVYVLYFLRSSGSKLPMGK
jgi:hypothetical protein